VEEAEIVRITLDIDDRSVRNVKKVIKRVEKFLGKKPDEIYVTRKGFHLVIKGLKISFWESLVWRALLGDDPYRVIYDMRCETKPKQILFSSKGGVETVRISLEELNYKNVSRIRRKLERKARQRHYLILDENFEVVDRVPFDKIGRIKRLKSKKKK